MPSKSKKSKPKKTKKAQPNQEANRWSRPLISHITLDKALMFSPVSSLLCVCVCVCVCVSPPVSFYVSTAPSTPHTALRIRPHTACSCDWGAVFNVPISEFCPYFIATAREAESKPRDTMVPAANMAGEARERCSPRSHVPWCILVITFPPPFPHLFSPLHTPPFVHPCTLRPLCTAWEREQLEKRAQQANKASSKSGSMFQCLPTRQLSHRGNGVGSGMLSPTKRTKAKAEVRVRLLGRGKMPFGKNEGGEGTVTHLGTVEQEGRTLVSVCRTPHAHHAHHAPHTPYYRSSHCSLCTRIVWRSRSR
jgi:hypothetical protein